MRRHYNTPSEILGMIALLFALLFGVGSIYWAKSVSSTTNRIECIARLDAKGWAALGKLAEAPVGDTEARAAATKLFVHAGHRLERLDHYCP